MGIVAVKNLVEEGFEVTGFERSPYVGGLWHYTTEKDTLSVLSSEYIFFSLFSEVINGQSADPSRHCSQRLDR